MKRKYEKQKVERAKVRELYPYKNTPLQLCFEAEIRRIAEDRAETMAQIISKLAEMSGVTERQIYNYRNGKTEIQPEQIRIFCEQFGCIALAMAWISTFAVEQEDFDLYDLSRFASQTVRNVLKTGDKFLEAFEDGRIDGHEMNELELASAQIQRDARRMTEVARDNYNRRRAA